MRILIVEDKVALNNSLSRILRQHGYAVDQAFDGEEALDLFDVQVHDLMILDLTLPKIDGIDVIARLRAANVEVPILVLTARGTTAQIVDGLHIGADDYMAKPFEVEELLARIQVLLRRRTHQTSAVLKVDDLTLDSVSGEVRRGGRVIKLSRTEYNLLAYLMSKPYWIVTKKELLTHVWEDDGDVYDRVVDTYICFLRRKIDKAFPEHKQLIQTVKTRGYRIGGEKESEHEAGSTR